MAKKPNIKLPTEEYNENPFITIDAKDMFELFQVTDAATCIEDLFIKEEERGVKDADK